MRPPYQQQAEHVAEVMRGVRQQRHRMRRQAKDDFRQDKPGIERRAECERAVKTGRRRRVVVMVSAVAVIVPGMIVIAVVFVFVAVVMIVMVVAGRRHSYSAGTDESTLPSPVLSSFHA
jgi:hypothetical protein